MKRMVPASLFSRLVVLVVILFVSSGCARTTPVSYYQLSPLETKFSRSNNNLGDKSIGIGPLSLPEYLTRSQIVSRVSANRLELADSERWAEPLADNLTRVVAENISTCTGTDRVLLFPWGSLRNIDYQLVADILRFDTNARGLAVLEIRWLVKGPAHEVLLTEKQTRYETSSKDAGQESRVAALSQTVAMFCRQVAEEIAILAAQP